MNVPLTGAWPMGSEEPTTIVPVVVDNAVPAGPLRGRDGRISDWRATLRSNGLRHRPI